MINPYLQMFDGARDDRALSHRAARNFRDIRAAGENRRRRRQGRRSAR
ncbi:hypothetical protein [Microlunatus soli]|uniref:Uncharacterized protein n=1 Tax=Microlunatus soli TaxID=630515 RepID=A0A1H1T716_9ACTN|nr:hypothetical protein [Microlunatus soli]SDS55429.1 hypothetical protein SAMN04489812_2261 [Microlunatus soli]